ncbi:MAG: DUF6858 family protein [Thiohalomonadaceae bacterium]|jgi:hypothetical protein
MKKMMLQDVYPVYSLELPKSETQDNSVDAIIDFLKARIEEHPAAVYIGVFDHYSHTKSLPEGEIAPEILDAKNLIFCFGIKLPNPGVLAVRPRSIGVVELADKFIVNYMEAPMPMANQAMESWFMALKNK